MNVESFFQIALIALGPILLISFFWDHKKNYKKPEEEVLKFKTKLSLKDIIYEGFIIFPDEPYQDPSLDSSFFARWPRRNRFYYEHFGIVVTKNEIAILRSPILKMSKNEIKDLRKFNSYFPLYSSIKLILKDGKEIKISANPKNNWIGNIVSENKKLYSALEKFMAS